MGTNNKLEFDINSKSSALKTAYDLAKEKGHLSVIGALTCFGVSTPDGGEYGHSATSIARYPAILEVYHHLSIRVDFTKITLIGPGMLWLSRPSDLKVVEGYVSPIITRFFANQAIKDFEELKSPKEAVLTWSDVLPFYFSIFPKAELIVVDRPDLIDRALHSTMLTHSEMYGDMLNFFLHSLMDESSGEVMTRFVDWHKQGNDFSRDSVGMFPKDLFDNLIEFKPDKFGQLPQSFAALPVKSTDCNLIVALNVLQYPALRCRYESQDYQYDLDKILLSLFHSMGNSGKDVLIVTKDSLSPYMEPGGLLFSVIKKGIVSLEEIPDGSKGNYEKLIVLKLNSPKACSHLFSEFFKLYPDQTRRK